MHDVSFFSRSIESFLNCNSSYTYLVFLQVLSVLSCFFRGEGEGRSYFYINLIPLQRLANSIAFRLSLVLVTNKLILPY